MKIIHKQTPEPQHPLYTTLYSLWQDYLELTSWVPLDRWLSIRLRTLPKLSQRQKLWLGRQLQDACRLAICILFCERLFLEQAADDTPKLPLHLADLARRMGEAEDEGADVKKSLLSMKAEDFFFWLRLRRSAMGHADTSSDPLPTPRHRSARARRIWPELSRLCRDEAELPVRLIWHGLPPHFAPHLAQRAKASAWDSETLDHFINRHEQPSPVWLRLNRADAMAELREDLLSRGFTIHSERDDAMQVSGSSGLFEMPTHQTGLFEVQDLASQQIGRSVDVHPGQFIWDACAGYGGKSLQLAAALRDKGALYASDNHENKLEKLRLRARRSGLGNSLRTVLWTGEEALSLSKEIALRQGFDRVLVDAPCSGTGTWRRNPDGRLDFDPQRIARLQALQHALLTRASEAVRPGGLLVYATCSILVTENEHIVAAFLDHDGRFTLKSQHILGNPAEDCDTTFAAVLEKRSD
jgi:16S rRNA (cytosine967-C5)-methyltransferase